MIFALPVAGLPVGRIYASSQPSRARTTPVSCMGPKCFRCSLRQSTGRLLSRAERVWLMWDAVDPHRNAFRSPTAIWS